MPMNFWVRVFWNVSTEAAMNICLSESDSGAFGRRLWLPRSWRTEDGLRQTGTLNNNTCLSFRRFNHSNFIAPVSTRNVSEFWSQDWVSSITIRQNFSLMLSSAFSLCVWLLDVAYIGECSELDWDFFWSDVGWMYEFFDHIHLADHQVSI